MRHLIPFLAMLCIHQAAYAQQPKLVPDLNERLNNLPRLNPIDEIRESYTEVIFKPDNARIYDTSVVRKYMYQDGRLMRMEEYKYLDASDRRSDQVKRIPTMVTQGEMTQYRYDDGGKLTDEIRYMVKPANSWAMINQLVKSRVWQEMAWGTKKEDLEKRLDKYLDSLLRVGVPGLSQLSDSLHLSYNPEGLLASSESYSRNLGLRQIYTYDDKGRIRMRRQEHYWPKDNDRRTRGWVEEHYFSYDARDSINSIISYQATNDSMPNIAVPKLLRRQEYRFVNAQGGTDSIFYQEHDRAYRYRYKYDGQGKPTQILVLDSTYRRPYFDSLSFTAVAYNATGRTEELYQVYAFPNGNSMLREKFLYDGSGRLVEALQYSWSDRAQEPDHPLQQHLYFYGTKSDKQTAARKIKRPAVHSLPMPRPVVQKPASPVEPSKEVFRFVEQMPEFPGDMQAYLREHLHYPAAARKKGTEGRVVLQFIVETNGSIRDVKVVRSASPELDAEAVRVAKTMPAWTPGKQNGQRVAVYMNVPVTFRLE